MCGVVGLLIRDRALEPSLGALLVPMIEALADRGPDSSGIGVYSDARTGSCAAAPASDAGTTGLRLSLGSDGVVDWPALCGALGERFGRGLTVRCLPRGALLEMSRDGAALAADFVAQRWPEVRVLSRGRSLTVIKDTGRPEKTCATHGLRQWTGYLGIAHTRMATESAVTLLHSHPFVPDDDLCVVHNGSFSNYATVRRWLTAQGAVFESDNDSEVAARLLAARLTLGDDLAEATRWVMEELDGFFTLVITTGSAMSVVRDPFACKPAVVAETSCYVAVASEYRALAHLPDIADADVFEPRPEEVYTWKR